ncbi:MAG: outer membrane protein assembly factor BamE [candidate division Zixibacteria bacterium]|nr:outer membrane protein assembly factor BamE [candidate division Zixibacteria bacterium]
MTHEQVLELLGEPETIHYVRRDTITEEYWNYPTSSRASTSNRCRFDSTTQRVIVVYCRDRSRK